MRKFTVTSVAFDAQQNGWPQVRSPPDLCCSDRLELRRRDVFALNHTQSGHHDRAERCPLSGVKRTWVGHIYDATSGFCSSSQNHRGKETA
jgi:hypothetical protein